MAFELGLRRSTALADARFVATVQSRSVTRTGANQPFRYGHDGPYVARRAQASAHDANPPPTRVGATGPKPLRPTPNIITGGDLREYRDLLVPLINSLDSDVERNLATGNADELRKQAKVLETFPLPIYPDGTTDTAAYIARLRAKADAIDRKKLSSEQIATEAAFTKEWNDFYARWRLELEDVNGVINQFPVSMTSGGDWTKLQGYDVEYQTLAKRYTDLGYTLSDSVPPSAPDIPGSSIPWGWIIFGVVLIGGALVFGQVRGLFGSHP